jgi:hypothetical protein
MNDELTGDGMIIRTATANAAMPWWSRRRAMGEEAAPVTRAEHAAMASIGARPVHDEGEP